MVKPFFRGTRKKWLLDIGMDKMVTTGRLILHLQRALELSSQWGPPQSEKEFHNLKSQIVISSWGGLRRSLPYAFTEQGVAMLSSVLRSGRAIQVNIAIMRAFVKLREILSAHKELAQKLVELEQKIERHDKEIKGIFEAIRQLMAPAPTRARRKIGF